ncbi:(2Fe-2S)-binding protein [Stappia sp. F7233]|uniref:(2Fe-2S)-binding protein n=1 Tax=Stappia albiluteola TaxID=2758565 RepID=A0A839ABE3_9HYPH|nr:(2Fe-2S)-binding protein [Stappia albiluteola]MBA5776272.1 (2Fe-2S)-binding protein [Stappia albiluteola]
MIVCSCNVITDKELREAAARLREANGGSVVTPGAVFRELGHRPRCGGCFVAVVPIIHEVETGDGSAATGEKAPFEAPKDVTVGGKAGSTKARKKESAT